MNAIGVLKKVPVTVLFTRYTWYISQNFLII